MTIDFSIDESSDTFQALLEGMKAFNKAAVGVGGAQKFNVALREENGHIVGGVAATLAADSLYLDVVWNDDSVRGQGHGRAMMEKIEAEGRRRGAHYAWLYTMSWQARPFYEKLGYACVGEMPFLDGRHRQYVMWKRL
jgi:ribosomal protein S18 acetylase RimI-like enzyme